MKRHDLEDLKNALAELDQELDQIRTQKIIDVCPYCYHSLQTNEDRQVLDYCMQCDTELPVYYRYDTITDQVVQVSNQFY